MEMRIKIKINIGLILLAFIGGVIVGRSLTSNRYKNLDKLSSNEKQQAQQSTDAVERRENIKAHPDTPPIQNNDRSVLQKKEEKKNELSKEKFSSTVYKYIDESRIGNLLNEISQNTEDSSDLSTIAKIGTPEIIEEIKEMAFDTTRPPHVRAASILACNWTSDSDKLINFLGQEDDSFIIEAIITSLDETSLPEEKRGTANHAVLKACDTKDEDVLRSANTYFSDKIDGLAEIIADDFKKEISSDIVEYFLENIPWEDNKAAFNKVITYRPDIKIKDKNVVIDEKVTK
jgi:hypothetical protein